MNKLPITVYALCFLWLCFVFSTYANDSLAAGEGVSAGISMTPLDCVPIDPADMDSTLGVPVISQPPEYESSLCNIITWASVADSRVEKYYVEVSLSASFHSIFTCALIDSLETAADICVALEDTVWYRVRSAYNDIDLGVRFSLPSDSVYIIQDTALPVLHIITPHDLNTGLETYTSRREINVDFFGSDKYPGACEFLELSEDIDFAVSTRYPIATCSGTRPYTLSEGKERKIIYGRLIDRAGNTSRDEVSAVIEFQDLAHNYPNPFSPREDECTHLVFGLTESQAVSVYIYDLFGNLVLKRENIQGFKGLNDGGSNPDFNWDGKNSAGHTVADGGYLCVIKVGEDRYRIKIAVVN
jgi:hypothetical protein